jgi:hypothetical protein
MRELPASLCPVPREQQPVNEYEQLKESWLFSWATLDWSHYGRKLAWLAFWIGLLVCPIAAASFPPRQFPLGFALASSMGTMTIVALLVMRLLLGWYYIRDRLQSENIVYEESGWYDGQIWHKPAEILTRDRLIVTYQIDPLLQRLRRTFYGLGVGMILGCILWSGVQK